MIEEKEIRESILTTFGTKKVDPQNLNIFAKDFLSLCPNEPSTPAVPSLGKSLIDTRLDERDKIESLLNRFGSFAKTFEDFKVFSENDAGYSYLEHFIQEGKIEVQDSKYLWVGNDEEMIFPEVRIKRFQEDIAIFQSTLQVALKGNKKGQGRKRDVSRDYSVGKISAMIDCLLDLRISKTSSTSRFNDILSYCLELLDDNYELSDPKNLIYPCFNDYNVIISMAQIYHTYNRLDLYISHVCKTSIKEHISDYFENEWVAWKKPNNYEELFR